MTRALAALAALACSPPAPARTPPDVAELLGEVRRDWGPCGAVVVGARALLTAAHCADGPELELELGGRVFRARAEQPDPWVDVARLTLPSSAPAALRFAAVRPGGPELGELVWVETPLARGWAAVALVSVQWRAAILSWHAVRGDSGGSAWSVAGELLCIVSGATVPGSLAFCEVIP